VIYVGLRFVLEGHVVCAVFLEKGGVDHIVARIEEEPWTFEVREIRGGGGVLPGIVVVS